MGYVEKVEKNNTIKEKGFAAILALLQMTSSYGAVKFLFPYDLNTSTSISQINAGYGQDKSIPSNNVKTPDGIEIFTGGKDLFVFIADLNKNGGSKNTPPPSARTGTFRTAVRRGRDNGSNEDAKNGADAGIGV